MTVHLAKFALVAILAATAGCRAQVPSFDANGSIQDAVLARRIEVLVRSQFNVPAGCTMKFGSRKPSKLAGYDTLPVLISLNGRSTTVEVLLSSDNKTLARFDAVDLDKIPAQHIPVEGRPVRGNPAAKVTVVSFDDLECPYCARMHQQLFPETMIRYGDKVNFVYKDDPLTEIHPWALHAAVDANCIANQNGNAYWGYVDYLHAHGHDVSGDDGDAKKSSAVLDKIAREQGKIFSLDASRLDACLQKQDDSAVRASMKEAESLGVEGTPYLFIDGERIDGAQPKEQVWLVIDRALRAAGVEPPPLPSAPAPPPTLGR